MKWPVINNVDDFAKYVLLLFCFSGIIISSVQIFKKKHKAFMLLIPIFLITILAQILINEYVTFFRVKSIGKTNLTNISLSIYIIIEEAILLSLITISSNSVFIRKYSKVFIPIFTGVNILCWTYITKWSNYLSFVSTLEALIMIFACLYYYYEILSKPPTLNLINEPSFWIVSGVFVLFICLTPINLAIESTFFVDYLKSLDSIAYILITLLFLKASACKAQIKI